MLHVVSWWGLHYCRRLNFYFPGTTLFPLPSLCNILLGKNELEHDLSNAGHQYKSCSSIKQYCDSGGSTSPFRPCYEVAEEPETPDHYNKSWRFWNAHIHSIWAAPRGNLHHWSTFGLRHLGPPGTFKLAWHQWRAAVLGFPSSPNACNHHLWSCEKQGFNLQLSNLMLGKEVTIEEELS